MVQFVKINLKEHLKEILAFRKDSFILSFGDETNFDESDYLHWLENRQEQFPEGFVLVKENGNFIGQLEVTIQHYEDKEIGYVNLYYLISEERGKGKGAILHNYAKQFFINHSVNEFHLRVSPTNLPAIKFYKRLGMKEIGPEHNGKVVRMGGSL